MAALEANGLVKVYGTGEAAVPVLHGVDLRIPQGAFVSIMGPSGSGKSTLLHLLGLLDTPTRGQVSLLGRPTASLDGNARADARRKALGFVFQSFHLIPRMDALHNVMVPLALAGVARRDRVARATKMLGAVGLADRLRHTPAELSGGQKQRVAIARALALDPPILLADEPTGNLDSRTSRDVMGLFRRLHASGKTIVQVTHDAHMAQFGDVVVHMRDGQIERTRVRPGVQFPTEARPGHLRRRA